jgi:hypothetical protein
MDATQHLDPVLYACRTMQPSLVHTLKMVKKYKVFFDGKYFENNNDRASGKGNV